MKANGSTDAAVVEFTGKVRRIARVHQYGIEDRPNQYGRNIICAKRHLLGFNRFNSTLINLVLIKYLK